MHKECVYDKNYDDMRVHETFRVVSTAATARACGNHEARMGKDAMHVSSEPEQSLHRDISFPQMAVNQERQQRAI